MYIGLAHTGVGAAVLTVAAVCTTLSGVVVKLRARRAIRRNQGAGQ